MIENLLDTSILIDIWRNGDGRWKILDNCLNYISTVTYIEFLQGAKHNQKAKAEKFLQQYIHVPINPAICSSAIELIRRYAQTEGLRLADSLIAATCLENDYNLLTLNRKHFQSIADLRLI